MDFDLATLRRELAELAARGVFLGTSSWKYPGWCGTVYDEARYQWRGRFAKTRFDKDCLAEYAGTFKTVSVDCPAGKKALGGGVALTSGLWAMRVIQSAPSGGGATGWLATVANDASNFTTTFYVWAICASV